MRRMKIQSKKIIGHFNISRTRLILKTWLSTKIFHYLLIITYINNKCKNKTRFFKLKMIYKKKIYNLIVITKKRNNYYKKFTSNLQ